MDRITLTASEGMMLTDGKIFAKRITLGNWDRAENYREISMREYEEMTKEEEFE